MVSQMSSTSIDDPCLVKLSNVAKHFGKLQAIKDISITIEPGECVGLVGHNGAGKSTLIKIINGRLKPTTGSVSYSGSSEQARANDVQARSIGIRSVFQELSLCPNLTVLENWRIPYRGMARSKWRSVARERITAELDRIFPGHGISPKTTVADLTIAERQMVEIAIAFCKRDKPATLVILDEPTSSLDAAIARQLLDYIRIFCAAGGAVIFITHMLGEIFDVSSRIVVMEDGCVIATLSSSFIFQSLAIWSNRGLRIKPPELMSQFVSGDVLGIPNVALVGILIAVVAWFLLERAIAGRWILAIGQNMRAAQLSGVPINSVRFGVYVSCAVLAAVAGFLLANFSGGAALNMGTEYMLMSIAVVVIGGSSIAGGKSNVPGIWGAALFMFLLVSMLNSFGLGAGVRLMLTGIIIVAVVTFASTSGEKR
jgi:ABC-type multidrug transport system ATPase subunit